jgi:2-polyprenyl-3-methyl-5-hydroxy-6-metoxy-1,4-benzoquinol methylase
MIDTPAQFGVNCAVAYLSGKNERETKQQLFEDIVAFLEALPPSSGLECTKLKDFLFHFEAARLLIVRDMLLACGIKPEEKMEVLDFGYLHGLFQEFVHRFFPNAHFQVCDRPDSPIFTDPAYLELIRQRTYLNLVPRDINDLDASMGPYRVILLGEIIEHLDPSRVMEVLRQFRKMIQPGGVLVITTPNGGSLYNCLMTLQEKDRVQVAPVPDPLTGVGHIHLWSGPVLRQTAEYVGWSFKNIKYYHGREGEKFVEVRKKWGSLKTQVLLRGIEFLANRTPRYRGFFVATFVAEK